MRQPHSMVPRCCWCGAYTYPTEGYTVPLARHGLPGHYIAVLILTLENDLVVDQQSAQLFLMYLLAYRQSKLLLASSCEESSQVYATVLPRTSLA